MTLPVGGIKLSPRLVQIDVARGAGAEAGLDGLLAGLAAEEINLPFFTRLPPGTPVLATLCLAETDRHRAEETARSVSGLEPRLTVLCPVIAVSIFPHRSKAALLRAVMELHADRGLPLLGMTTSLSALTLLLGLMLTLMPLPTLIEPARPYWLALFVIYWNLEGGRLRHLGQAFALGLLLDPKTFCFCGQIEDG